jgi:hypothetical protein
LAFGAFFGLTTGTGNGGPSDYVSTIAAHTAPGTGRVPFPQNGPAAGGIVRVDASSFTLPATGTYKVTATVHTTEPGQLQLEINGVPQPQTTSGNQNPTAGGHTHTIDAIITTGAPNAELAVINPAGNTPALTITPADGASTHANAQTLTVLRIA